VAPAENSTYAVAMGFMPIAQAIADPDHAGLLRAGPRSAAPYGDDRVESHLCAAVDLAASGTDSPDLLELGFDVVDLSALGSLQVACGDVLEAGRISDVEAATIRAALDGAVLRCASGRTLTVLYLADEGFIMRCSGPNRMSVVAPRATGMNDHGGATSVHADQDVFGTPLTQLMEGRAPSLFRHDSPDGQNRDAALMLVNLWIPLQQITQPLVLADGRSIDRRRHQLRYGLATGSFLERDDDLEVNDIWTFLHDPEQRWYFRSEMDHLNAYVFDTLSTPHGAGVLPGEDIAEHCYVALVDAESAVSCGDVAGLGSIELESNQLHPPESTTPALRNAIEGMVALLREAQANPELVVGERRNEWLVRAAAARRGVVRMSLEMRLVVSIDS